MRLQGRQHWTGRQQARGIALVTLEKIPFPFGASVFSSVTGWMNQIILMIGARPKGLWNCGAMFSNCSLPLGDTIDFSLASPSNIQSISRGCQFQFQSRPLIHLHAHHNFHHCNCPQTDVRTYCLVPLFPLLTILCFNSFSSQLPRGVLQHVNQSFPRLKLSSAFPLHLE